MVKNKVSVVVTFLGVFGLFVGQPLAQSNSNDAFGSSWKLLSEDGKSKFISGYLYCANDTARILDIAIGFVKENPTRAIQSLETLRNVYNTSGLSPDNLTSGVNRFYKDPDNLSASLTKAISAAKLEQ